MHFLQGRGHLASRTSNQISARRFSDSVDLATSLLLTGDGWVTVVLITPTGFGGARWLSDLQVSTGDCYGGRYFMGVCTTRHPCTMLFYPSSLYPGDSPPRLEHGENPVLFGEQILAGRPEAIVPCCTSVPLQSHHIAVDLAPFSGITGAR